VVKSPARSSTGFPTGDCSRVSWSRSGFYCRFLDLLRVSVHLLPACFSLSWLGFPPVEVFLLPPVLLFAAKESSFCLLPFTRKVSCVQLIVTTGREPLVSSADFAFPDFGLRGSA
jgi:hypothetical protein